MYTNDEKPAVTTEAETETVNKPGNSKKTKKVIGISAAAVVVAIIILLLSLRSCSTVENPGSGSGFNIGTDSNATDEELAKRSQEEIVADLNQQVQEGMINISMNLYPTFENGTAKGNLLIVNSERNKYPQFVTITRDDTSEVIYTSGGIPVGSRIDNAALDVKLSAGTYDCTAKFTQYDESTETVLGSAQAKISITIQK